MKSLLFILVVGFATHVPAAELPTGGSVVNIVEWDEKFDMIKINPLATWSEAQVWGYILKNSVAYNPLHDVGYPSIGCTNCTRAVKPGEDPRAGRWSDFED